MKSKICLTCADYKTCKIRKENEKKGSVIYYCPNWKRK